MQELTNRSQTAPWDIRRLDCLREGEGGLLCRIGEHHPLSQRLVDLGWTQGTPIVCLRISPLGDPVAYGIRGGVIALRRQDAQGIFVCVQGGSGG